MRTSWRGGGLAFALLMACSGGVAQAQDPEEEYVGACTTIGTSYFKTPGSDVCIHADTQETRLQVTDDLALRGRTTLAREVASVGAEIDWMDAQLDDLREGIAATAALPRPFIEAGDRYAVSGDWGQYQGANALGLGAAIRIADTVSLSAAFGVGLESGVIASGLNLRFGW